MRPWVTELAKHGIDATALNLPKSNNDRAIDVFRGALDLSLIHIWNGPDAFIAAAAEPFDATGVYSLSAVSSIAARCAA